MHHESLQTPYPAASLSSSLPKQEARSERDAFAALPAPQPPLRYADSLAASPSCNSDLPHGVQKNVIFFGESNLLTSVAGEDQAPSDQQPHAQRRESTRLCYPISEAIRDRASAMSYDSPCGASAVDYLTREGAFARPAPAASDAILHAYFTWFHPCFPVVDRAVISAAYAARSVSPLLLNAMLFVGSTYASAQLLVEAGFGDRHEAKSCFYHRAKLLYDAGWEDDKIVVLQALFMISFWRAGPLNEKDTRHWLGAAIGLAQARGLHRL